MSGQKARKNGCSERWSQTGEPTVLVSAVVSDRGAHRVVSAVVIALIYVNPRHTPMAHQ